MVSTSIYAGIFTPIRVQRNIQVPELYHPESKILTSFLRS